MPTLHAYRHAYHLPTPSAFSRSLNQMILQNSASGVGNYSPTVAGASEAQRRVDRDQLAGAVGEHFAGLAVQEGEAVVDFLYKVRWQGE